MNSFERIGEGQLLAHEGRRQLTVAFVGLLKKTFLHMIDLISRSAPGPFLP